MWLILAPYESGAIDLDIVPQTQTQAQAPGTGGDAATNLKGMELIKTICEERGNEELCIKVLSSDPISSIATLQDLAMISLKVAGSYAKDILDDAKRMIDDPDLTPQMQQGVSDCKENLLDAESQIQDSVASILNNDKLDAQKWLKAALAAIDTCDASIPGDDDILSRRSVQFRQLCNIAVAINKNMMGIKS
ncbi:hypothetical protein Fmac_028046 [Flemingia macrophylla]|uniref:Pectinesterase inhibitor domain-containing protein n=1 Tax=Flemingia macrophylla TaxID=520843 RepID=A0ABD1LJG3_9FABA